MPCFTPIQGYILINQKTDSGKQLITFKQQEVKGRPYTSIDLPCGQCIGCKIDKSRSWAIRCVHEASLYKEINSFITLTINDENLNDSGTLVKRDFQNFMKELRRQAQGFYAIKNIKTNRISYPIRFFHCGEYGEACRKYGRGS